MKHGLKKGNTFCMDDLLQASRRVFMQRTRDIRNHFLSFNNTSISTKIKPLEIHSNSIVIKGFKLEPGYKPYSITFKTRHKTNVTKVIDSMITPEVAILYIDKNPTKWRYTKGCMLEFVRDHTTDGLFAQMQNIGVQDLTKTFTIKQLY